MGACQSRDGDHLVVGQAYTAKGDVHDSSAFPRTPGGRTPFTKDSGLKTAVSPSEQTAGTLPVTPGFSSPRADPPATTLTLNGNALGSLRASSLVAPPKATDYDAVAEPIPEQMTSVTPQTIAHFNRLKVQVEQANKVAWTQRRQEKVEDRYKDVNGYRNLWQEYEQIQELVQDNSPEIEQIPKVSTELSLNLQDPESWFFDFHALDQQRFFHGDEDDRDARSMSNLSLHSEAEMKSQNEYFANKRRKRILANKRRYSEKRRNKMSNNGSIRSSRSMPAERFQRRKLEGDEKHEESVTSLRIVAYAPPQDADNTPKTHSGRNVDGECHYGAQIEDDDLSIMSYSDVENDYKVESHGRRRHSLKDDSSIETFDDTSITRRSNFEFDLTNFSQYGTDMPDEPVNVDCEKSTFAIGSKSGCSHGPRSKTVTTSPASRIDRYGFDPCAPLSSQLEIFAQAVPSVQIDSAETGVVRWRQFPKENYEKPKTARKLDGLFAGGDWATIADPHEAAVEKKERSTRVEHLDLRESQTTTPEKTPVPSNDNAKTPATHRKMDLATSLSTMSPEHFLMMSCCTATPAKASTESSVENIEEVEEDKENSSFDRDDGKNIETLKTHDPVISSLSTDAFFRMSSWHTSTVPPPNPYPTDEHVTLESKRSDNDLAEGLEHSKTIHADAIAESDPELETVEDYTPLVDSQDATKAAAIASQVEASVRNLLTKFRSDSRDF